MQEQYDFLLHPGLGKTGTTYIRSVLSQERGILYLGKDHKDRYMTSELETLHYILFPSCDPYSSKRPSAYLRNSRNFSIEYAKKIAHLIKTEQSRQVVLSDEAIFSFGIFDGELNVLLAARLIKDIEQELNAPLKVKVLLTIREQASMLQAHYAYDYVRWGRIAKTPAKFIDLLMNEGNKNAKFASFRFDEVLDLMDATVLGADINILPLELLVRDPDAYHAYLASLLGKVELTTKPSKKMMNSNRIQEGTVIKNIIRKPTLLNKAKFTALEATLPAYQRVKGHLPAGARKALRELRERYASVSFKNDQAEKLGFAFTDEQNAKVRAYFAAGNAKIQQRTAFDLKTLGYGV